MAKENDNNGDDPNFENPKDYKGKLSIPKEWQNVIEDTIKKEAEVRVRKSVRDEFVANKSYLLTFFGIFATIVIFLSVEFQILKTISYFWNVVGFSLVMLATLLFFVLALDTMGTGYLHNFKKEYKEFLRFRIWFFCVIGGIFLLGLSFIRPNKEEIFKENRIFKKYEKNFERRQAELEIIYDKEIQTLQNEIMELKKDLPDKIKENSDKIKALQNVTKK